MKQEDLTKTCMTILIIMQKYFSALRANALLNNMYLLKMKSVNTIEQQSGQFCDWPICTHLKFWMAAATQ